MKKYSLFRYLFLIIFFIIIKCNDISNILDNTNCEELVCKSTLNDFIINVSVSMIPYDNELIESISDIENYFGVLKDATDGHDSDYDILEPPNNPGNWISLYFPHPEWENNLGDNFTQDIRGNILEDQEDRTIEWNFNVEVSANENE